MRVPSAVEEDQAARVGPQDRALPLNCIDVRRGRIVREYEFAAGSRQVFGAEEKARQRIRADMAFKPHRGPALNIQDDAIAIVECGNNPYIYLSVVVALQRQHDAGSDVEAGLVPITVPELLRLLRDIVIPSPRRDWAHRLHWPALRRPHQHRARQARQRWNACAEATP